MIQLLKFQLRNLYKQLFVYVCAILSLSTLILSLHLPSYIINIRKVLADEDLQYFFTSEIKLIGIGLTGFIFICLFMCLDSSNCITKNIISRGFSRISLFFSKFIVVTAFSIMLILAQVFIIVTYLNLQDPNLWSNLLKIIICVIPEICLYIFISTLANKNGLSIAFCIIIDSITSLVLAVIDCIICLIRNKQITSIVSKYWVSSLSKLDTTPQILLSLGYTVLFIALSVIIVSKREVK